MLIQNIFRQKSSTLLLQYKTKPSILYIPDVVINKAHPVISLMLMSHILR